MDTCIHTHNKSLCRKCRIINDFTRSAPQVKLHFTGPSPPEIFVGRIGYPDIQAGILAPPSFDTKHDYFQNAENWSEQNLSIANILRLRGGLVYGKSVMNIKKPSRLKRIMDELALTHKRVATEFFLKKQPNTQSYQLSPMLQPFSNPAPIKEVRIEDNAPVHRHIDMMVNDTDATATTAIHELQNKVSQHHLQKLLSVGLLGKKENRRMVPTRWSITAIDDTVSKEHLTKIRDYPEIDAVHILTGNYVGNYIMILMLPGRFAFEAMEIWSEDEEDETKTTMAQDYEGHTGRTTYASHVTGGYYAMRLAVCEYLQKIRRQGKILVFREITHEYYAALGVGIVREATRRATREQPRTFESDTHARHYIKNHQKLIHNHLEQSWLLTTHNRQRRLTDFKG